MKNSKLLAAFLLVFAIVSTSYAQGNKFTVPVPYPWDENLVPIDCIGQYTGTIVMNMTFFDTGKILNKASGEITDSEGNEYTVKSLFNCHLFVRNISASGNSNQVMTFRVRAKDSGELVATVHFTWHYEDFNGEGDASFVNVKSVCH